MSDRPEIDAVMAEVCEQIGRVAAATTEPDDDGDHPHGVVTKLVLVAEVLDVKGGTWLVTRSSNADGDTLPAWTIDGMIRAAQRE